MSNDLKFKKELANLVSDFVEMIIAERILLDVEIKIKSLELTEASVMIQLRARRAQMIALEKRLMDLMRHGINRLIVATGNHSDN